MSQAFHGGRLRQARERFGRTDFLDFSVNTNPFWTAPTTLPEGEFQMAWTRYPEADAAGVSTRIAGLFDVQTSHLQATAGAIEALYLAVRFFSGQTACILQPSFADYSRACTAAGVAIRSIPALPGTDQLLPLVPQLSAANLIIVGTPANPTGAWFHDLKDTIAHPLMRHVHWILDEAFIDFTSGGAPLRSFLPHLKSHPKVLVLGAFTKSWGLPGLRLGFAATSHTAWMEKIRSIQPPWSIHGFAEHWIHAHLNAENLAAMRRSLEALPPTRSALRSQLEELPGLRSFDSEANYLLVYSHTLGAPEITDLLGQKGLLVRLCEGFEELDASRFFRVAIRRPEENNRLLETLSVILKKNESPQPHAPGAVPWDQPPKKRALRSVSVLGTSSNSGKSWMATALCALLHRRGLRVAPFKAQNMSNHSAVTWDGGEIGRAQAAQAEACGMAPSVRMNPILLKPSGRQGSQLVVLGKARGHVLAGDYYRHIESLWPVVVESLTHWEERADVLVLEGAGSPVELNLLDRDLVNLRPIRHLDGRWLLVADIERGGVFAQAAGTWSLIPPADHSRCLGLVVNKFRGDLALFADAGKYFEPHFGAPYLGTLPFRNDLQPEGEDSLCIDEKNHTHSPGLPGEAVLHWIRLPLLSNAQDSAPWDDDTGIHVRWTTDPREVSTARVIILPGSKNTVSDLAWLHRSGLADAMRAAHARGAHIVGICGGFQMLGLEVSDPEGIAGDAGTLPGLGLLPARTGFSREKEVRNVTAEWQGEQWMGYEIHMGQTHLQPGTPALLRIADRARALDSGVDWREEGARMGRVWGTYLHGFFESTQVRKALAQFAGATDHTTPTQPWRERRQAVYEGMADLLEEYLELDPLWRYVAD